MLVDPVTALARLGGSADVKALDELCGRRALRRASAAATWSGSPEADLPAGDVDGSFTTPLRTVLDLARHRPFGTALAAAACALRKRLFLPGDLAAGARGLRGPGCTQARRVAEHADARAASVLESALRAIMIEAGIASFEPQVEIHGDGFFARVDLGHRGRRIALEADSFEHHGHRAALARDCRRYTELTTRGWLVLRFPWEQVMFEPEWVVAMIRAALEIPPAGTSDPTTRSRCCGTDPAPRCACPADRTARQKSTVAKAPTSSKPTRR